MTFDSLYKLLENFIIKLLMLNTRATTIFNQVLWWEILNEFCHKVSQIKNTCWTLLLIDKEESYCLLLHTKKGTFAFWLDLYIVAWHYFSIFTKILYCMKYNKCCCYYGLTQFMFLVFFCVVILLNNGLLIIFWCSINALVLLLIYWISDSNKKYRYNHSSKSKSFSP